MPPKLFQAMRLDICEPILRERAPEEEEEEGKRAG
jgi:hypothetical protein